MSSKNTCSNCRGCRCISFCVACGGAFKPIKPWHQHCPCCWNWAMAGRRITQAIECILRANAVR